jgi:hypothetical protein
VGRPNGRRKLTPTDPRTGFGQRAPERGLQPGVPCRFGRGATERAIGREPGSRFPAWGARTSSRTRSSRACDVGRQDSRAVRFSAVPSTSSAGCRPHSIHIRCRFVDELVAPSAKFVDKPVARPRPGPYGSSCPKGPSQRTGEARGDPRSAAGPVGRAARFAPAGPPIRDTTGRDHIKVRRSQGRHRSWSVPSGVFTFLTPPAADSIYTPTMPTESAR